MISPESLTSAFMNTLYSVKIWDSPLFKSRLEYVMVSVISKELYKVLFELNNCGTPEAHFEIPFKISQ